MHELHSRTVNNNRNGRMGKSLASAPPFCNDLVCGPGHLCLKAQVPKMLQNSTASPILSTVCIYQAVDEDVVMEHAQRAELSADEVIEVADTVIVRDDP